MTDTDKSSRDSAVSLALVAGETSGDILGGHLLSALRLRMPNGHYYGIGGPRMVEQGFVSHWAMEKLSVNGFFEVFAHFREIKGIRDHLRETLKADPPVVFVGIDAPEFNLGLEAQLKSAGIPTVHVVGPSVWAWRKGRIKTIARAVSRILVLFPFEIDIYQRAGIPVTYVGHPLAGKIPEEADMAGARQTLGLSSSQPVVAILPGSRLSELKYNGAAFIGAMQRLAEREPAIQFVIPMAGDIQYRRFTEQLRQAGQMPSSLRLLQGESHTALAAADAVLVASGTATLEVALFKKPMVIAYRMMWGTWQIAKRVVTPPVGLPNILAGEMLVPELFQDDATPENLADAVWRQLHDQPLRRKLHDRFTQLHRLLLRDTAGLGAQAIQDLAEKKYCHPTQ
ncbi:MAG: lipid-A-disaccharide synthase [Burkholderiaceae bacterium]|jgi:lipid-A-disaccharide synthase|nr:lipid-A-disaccharide synthase [Burkholderiaceae bacterium]